MRVESPEDIFRLKKHPGQRLVHAEPKCSPGPLHLGQPQSTVGMGVIDEVLIAAQLTKPFSRAGIKAAMTISTRVCHQPGSPAPASAVAADSVWHSVPRPGAGFSSAKSSFVDGFTVKLGMVQEEARVSSLAPRKATLF